MSASYLVECRDCQYETTMLGDEFAQWAADRHRDETDHVVAIRCHSPRSRSVPE